MADGAKALENRADSLYKYALGAIQATGIAVPIRAPEFTINVAKNPQALLVTDDKQVPQAFKRHVPEAWEVDKTLIKEAMKGGATVPGCEWAPVTYRLSVR